jgi:hypothetical protein
MIVAGAWGLMRESLDLALDAVPASSSNDPTDQRVVISKSRDASIHRSWLYGYSAIR